LVSMNGRVCRFHSALHNPKLLLSGTNSRVRPPSGFSRGLGVHVGAPVRRVVAQLGYNDTIRRCNAIIFQRRQVDRIH
jgi:hypothetical protein